MRRESKNNQMKNIFKTALTLGLVILLPYGACAGEKCETDKDNSESWRAKPPTYPTPRDFKLPAVESYKMDNGLEVQLAKDNRFPYLTAYIGFKTGSVAEPEDKIGLADLTADQIKEGTTSRSSKEVASEADFIGGSVTAVSTYDFTVLRGSSLSNYAPRLLALMSDVLRNPSFPEKELKLKKSNWIQELVMKRSQPHYLLQERFAKVVFGSHPYSVLSPTPQMIEKLTRDDLVSFHKEIYIPDNAVLLVIGDFEEAEIKALIEKNFAAWSGGSQKKRSSPAMAKQAGRKLYLVDRPDSVQSSIKIGNLGIKKSDPDYFKIKVMNQILGGGAHSRLFLNIREDKGYTYGAYSSVTPRIDNGEFSASADVRTEVTSASIKEFLGELERIRDKPVSSEELDDAKNYLIGQFQLGLESQSGLAQRLLEVSLYDLSADYLETYASKVLAVTRENVNEAAKKAIDSDGIVITVVGDAKKVRESLTEFGTVEVYDAGGKLSRENEKSTPES